MDCLDLMWSKADGLAARATKQNPQIQIQYIFSGSSTGKLTCGCFMLFSRSVNGTMIMNHDRHFHHDPPTQNVSLAFEVLLMGRTRRLARDNKRLSTEKRTPAGHAKASP